MKYDDHTLFPFGKYRGTKMANIPASYLLWIRAEIKHLEIGLKVYIDENMEALKNEN